MERLCKVCGDFHDIERWPHNCLPEANWSRSSLSAPYMVRDTMDAARHPIDGKFYDSKAKFRHVTKAHGCIEVGTENPIIRPKAEPRSDDVKRDIARSIAELGG